ncbi:MAG: hypothetical protein ACKOK8_03345 [Planctomycetia bacterium]
MAPKPAATFAAFAPTLPAPSTVTCAGATPGTPPSIDCLYSDRHTIREQIARADLVIGSVLIPGARAPHLVEREDLKLMKPGAVIIDVAIDQGGCVATSRPTTHADPTFVVDDVVHYCVTNMPGAVGRTSTYALCNATLPYVLELAARGVEAAAATSPAMLSAVNVYRGHLVHRAVADAFGLPCEKADLLAKSRGNSRA